jgi:chromosome segregation ATPase
VSESELEEVVLALARGLNAIKDLALCRVQKEKAEQEVQKLRADVWQAKNAREEDVAKKNEVIDGLQAKVRHLEAQLAQAHSRAVKAEAELCAAKMQINTTPPGQP